MKRAGLHNGHAQEPNCLEFLDDPLSQPVPELLVPYHGGDLDLTGSHPGHADFPVPKIAKRALSEYTHDRGAYLP